MHLEKSRTYACTFPVQRKEINVVKVRFTISYSSRKFSHEKVITTACNFWRQIACSFLVKSGNVLLLGKKKKKWNLVIFSNPARGSGQKSSRMLSTFFHPEMWKGEGRNVIKMALKWKSKWVSWSLNFYYRGSPWGSRTEQHAYCLRYAHFQHLESHFGKKQPLAKILVAFLLS